MNTLQAIARILKMEGVEWIACFPSNNLIEAVAKEGINPVMFRQERGAIMAADGFSRLNHRDKFGVIITQGGPGAENAMGGLAQAYSDNVPILYLPGGPALSQHNVRPNFSPVRTYQSVSTFPQLRPGRPGPGIVEVPADVGTQDVPDAAFNYLAPKRYLQGPTVSAVKDAVRALLGAKKPLIWSGMGTLMAQASPGLRQLAELLEIPVYCTMPGKSGFDERHPLSLGAGSGATGLHARKWIQECDVLLALGSSLTRTGYGQPIPDGKTMIHNTESIADIGKDYNIDIGLPGDVQIAIDMLIDEVKGQLGPNGRKGQSNVAAEIAEVKQQWLSEWTELLNSNEVPINTYRVVGELERNIDKDNSIITHDAGAPRDSIMPFYTSTVPNSYIGWGKTTHLGYGIPLMIGAKRAKPDKFCLNLMGDGAFGMSGLDLETSVRTGTPITTVILNNGDMATYPGGYPTARQVFNTTHMSGDYAKIAEGLGAVGITVRQPGEIAAALQRAKQLNAEGKTVVLDIHSNMEGRRSRFDQGGG